MALTSIVRRAWERLFGRFYEGPEPPTRLLTMADDFARICPGASREEWVEVARTMAQSAYRAGWQRGFESAERQEERPWQALSPERIADLSDPTWRADGRGISIGGQRLPFEDAESEMGDG